MRKHSGEDCHIHQCWQGAMHASSAGMLDRDPIVTLDVLIVLALC